MGAFNQFLRDSGGWGLTSEVAALVFFGVGVWEHFHDRPITGYSFLVASVVLFCTGAYVAWLRKYRENVALSAKLDDRSTHFQLILESVNFQYEAAKDTTVFVLSAFLLNAGEPSVAVGWEGAYHVGNSVERMTGRYIIGSYTIAHGEQSIVLTNDHLMLTQVLTHRLDRGDRRQDE